MAGPIVAIVDRDNDASLVVIALKLDQIHKARLIELAKKVPKNVPRPHIADSVNVLVRKPLF